MSHENKTVLITGSSTGIGRETALFFLNKGWNVCATMRTPENSTFPVHEKLLVTHLDVTKQSSINDAFEVATQKFGHIDVVVNNAGYGLAGPLEGTTHEQIEKQFSTNVYGLMYVSQAACAHWRNRHKKGRIINIGSAGGRISFPLWSVYHATKWAVEGLSESLQYELARLGVKVKLIEPGAFKTDFHTRSLVSTDEQSPKDYNSLTHVAHESVQHFVEAAAHPVLVARTIYKAATDSSKKLRYPVGKDAKVLLFLRGLLPERVFYFLVDRSIFKHKV